MSQEQVDNVDDDIGKISQLFGIDVLLFKRILIGACSGSYALGALSTVGVVNGYEALTTQPPQSARNTGQNEVLLSSFEKLRYRIDRIEGEADSYKNIVRQRDKGNTLFRQSAESRLDKVEGEISRLKTRTKSISGSVEHIKSQLAGEG